MERASHGGAPAFCSRARALCGLVASGGLGAALGVWGWGSRAGRHVLARPALAVRVPVWRMSLVAWGLRDVFAVVRFLALLAGS